MKLPKITIEKNYTTIAQVDRVKADILEFRERYTCGDLFRAFQHATGYYDATCEEIATVEVGYDGADHGKMYNVEEFRLADLVGYSAGMRDLLLG